MRTAEALLALWGLHHVVKPLYKPLGAVALAWFAGRAAGSAFARRMTASYRGGER